MKEQTMLQMLGDAYGNSVANVYCVVKGCSPIQAATDGYDGIINDNKEETDPVQLAAKAVEYLKSQS